MSLTFASPSARQRVPQRARPGRSDRSDGRPRLRVVRKGERACAPRSGAVRNRERPPLRLTRRGRLVLRIGAFLLAGVAVLAGVLLLNRPAEAGSQVHPMPVGYRTVLPGETLWGIAGEVAPGTDRGNTVADLMDLNALTSPAVAAGQRIALPGR